MHQPSFSRRTRQVQLRCKQLLRPTHPAYTSRTILSSNRSEKPWSGPPLTMQQDDKHACLTVRSLVVFCDSTADLQEQV